MSSVWISMSASLSVLLAGLAVRAEDSPPPPAPSPAPADASTPREAQLEERLRKLEAMNQKILQRYEEMDRRHAERYDALSKEFRSLQQRLPAPAPVPVPAPASGGDDSPDGGSAGVGTGEPPIQRPGGGEGTIGRGSPSRDEFMEGGGAEGTAGERVGVSPFAPPSPVRTGGDTTRGGGKGRGGQGTIGRRGVEGESRPIRTTIGNGLRFDSEDGEFQLQFHDLTQSELRNFPGVGDQSPLKTQFFVPRQRWYFTGRATKNVEFYTVINRGYGSLDLLDAFLNFNFDPRIQFRAGRTKTPTSYEYYQIAEGDLIAPERSLFIGNFAGNRQNGFMFHGQVLKKSAEYAVGVFNGPRRSFGDSNSDKDLYTFFNIRPWMNSEDHPLLHYFNIGGAYNFGTQNNVPQPNILTTANDQSTAGSNATVRSLSPTFFQFNNNVVESGLRAQWSAWIAWYVKSFNVLAEYDGGMQTYALAGKSTRTRVPLEGFSVTAFYFLTGEQITRRVDIKPNRNFGIRDWRFTGPGAVEVFARYSVLDVGRDVFTAGLADPNQWTNEAYAIDAGLNWYLNQYTKIYMDWQHSIFGNAVANGNGTFLKGADLFWLRLQLFF